MKNKLAKSIQNAHMVFFDGPEIAFASQSNSINNGDKNMKLYNNNKIKISSVLAAFSIIAITACGVSKNSANENTPVGNQISAAAAAQSDAHNFAVTARALSVDGVAVPAPDANTFMGYPVLAARVLEAGAAVTVEQTVAGTLILRDAASAEIMVINISDGAVISSRSNFVADSIAYVLAASGAQEPTHASLTFELSECVDADQGQDQGQDGKDGKGKEQEQTCKAATVVLSLEEPAAPQDQDQGKVELPKEEDQDQGKK